MMALGDQAVNDLAGGVIGIGDKVKRRRDADETEQGEHFVEQGAAVAVGPHQTFMDACCERHGEEAVRCADEHADRLQGMPHDVFGLGVGVRLLMQQLDGRHFLAALGTLDAVADQNQPAVDAQRRWEQPQHHLGPQRGEGVELDAGAVKVGEQPVIERAAQVQRPHDTGHAQHVGAHRHAGHDGGEPQERAKTRECRAQQLHCIPPRAPQRQRPSAIRHGPDPSLVGSGPL